MTNEKFSLTYMGILTNEKKNSGIYVFCKKLSNHLNIANKIVILSNNFSQKKDVICLSTKKIFDRRVWIKNKDIDKISDKIKLWHIHFVSTCLYPLLIKSKKQKIITFHFMLGNKKIFLFGKGFFKNLLRKFIDDIRLIIDVNVYILFGNKFIFLSEAQLDNFKKYTLLKQKLNHNSFIINNFIEDKSILNKIPNSNKQINILFVGRLTKLKGIDDLIKLSNLLPGDFVLNIIGKGKFKKANNKNFKYHGEINNEEIFKYYDCSNVFILPSYTEVFPITILEAMARGLVILVSDIPGMREIITEGRNGYLFPPGEIKKMEEILLFLKNNPNKVEQIRKNNLKDIKKFSQKRQIAKYIKVYKEVLKEK